MFETNQPDASDVSKVRDAIKAGSTSEIVRLIDSGADIHYKCEHGYDALIDAVHSHVLDDGPRFRELIAFLIDKGVDLSGMSDYGESGLRVLSRRGQFEMVGIILNAGADESHLGWTPLIKAVALGTLGDVRHAVRMGAALEARDWWDRTAWLIALSTGSLEKAKFLAECGADTNARGFRNGQPPLFFAIESKRPEVVRWLLSKGHDVNQPDSWGSTALIRAVENDDIESVRILLEAGADVAVDVHGTPLSQARSREIIMCLLKAGANPADADHRTILGLEKTDKVLATVSPDEFQRGVTRRFGTSNPEPTQERFWEAMIRSGIGAHSARRHFGDSRVAQTSPVWTANRYGQSLTLLPDGRAVQVGGEHEDHYDRDFCIYNDVFVHESGKITIYGYPEETFPPTDFHTATLVGDFIYLIGSLGYKGTRRPGETPVYRLDVRTFRIERLITRGEAPGWIYSHRAVAVSPHRIRVWNGNVVIQGGNEESIVDNVGTFVLDLDDLVWHRESR